MRLNHLEVTELPQASRSALAGWLPGGRQDFPKDDLGSAYRSRLVREQMRREGRVLVTRIPKENVR